MEMVYLRIMKRQGIAMSKQRIKILLIHNLSLGPCFITEMAGVQRDYERAKDYFEQAAEGVTPWRSTTFESFGPVKGSTSTLHIMNR